MICKGNCPVIRRVTFVPTLENWSDESKISPIERFTCVHRSPVQCGKWISKFIYKKLEYFGSDSVRTWGRGGTDHGDFVFNRCVAISMSVMRVGWRGRASGIPGSRGTVNTDWYCLFSISAIFLGPDSYEMVSCSSVCLRGPILD